MPNPQKNDKPSAADRDRKSEDLSKDVSAELSDDLFTDRGAVNVSSPEGDEDAENKVATSLDNE